MPWLAWAVLIAGAVFMLALVVWLHIRAFAPEEPVEGGIAALAVITAIDEPIGLRQSPTSRLGLRFTASEGARAGEVIEASVNVDPHLAASLRVGGSIDVLYDGSDPTRMRLAGGRGRPIEVVYVIAIDIVLAGLVIAALWRGRS